MIKRKEMFFALGFIASFVLWTVLVGVIDVKSIGPNASKVGFSSLNKAIKELIGAHLVLYAITDWLGLVPIGVALGFAVLGLCQWIKRKSVLKVDTDILILGCFYIVVFFTYVLFEYLVINYRPILINGYLEASYPSSTTMLVTCVMPTSVMQINRRVNNTIVKRSLNLLILLFTVFMVVGRLLSGVHWLSDIIGGLLFSIGIVLFYHWLVNLK